MTKQEEIGEGINQILIKYEGSYAWELTTKIVTYLHDNNCVLKVDRKSPDNLVQEFSTEYDDGYHDAKMAMLKAGYAAFEPLLKEEE